MSPAKELKCMYILLLQNTCMNMEVRPVYFKLHKYHGVQDFLLLDISGGFQQIIYLIHVQSPFIFRKEIMVDKSSGIKLLFYTNYKKVCQLQHLNITYKLIHKEQMLCQKLLFIRTFQHSLDLLQFVLMIIVALVQLNAETLVLYQILKNMQYFFRFRLMLKGLVVHLF